MFDKKIKERLKIFLREKVTNKENFKEKSYEISSPDTGCIESSPFKQVISPILGNSKPIYEITNILKENQHFEKCTRCFEPAVVDGNISQCTRDLCGYIRCIKCNSFSTTGPEEFVDRCQQSRLVLDKPRTRHSLMDVTQSSMNDSGIPSFLLEDSPRVDHVRYSSGYMTDPNQSMCSRRHSDSYKQEKSRILQICNTDFSSMRKSCDRRNSIVPVIPVRNVRKVEDIIEPSSPPKINYVACSKKSKKMLKRLRY